MSIDPIQPGIVPALVGATFADHSTPTSCRCGERGPAPTGDRAALGAGDGVEGTNFKEAQ